VTRPTSPGCGTPHDGHTHVLADSDGGRLATCCAHDTTLTYLAYLKGTKDRHRDEPGVEQVSTDTALLDRARAHKATAHPERVDPVRPRGDRA
jgi:hypothetical protein